jgi:hypothetical protein
VVEIKDILDYISTWSVLQWIVLVLIAGFIGQFGKMMAETIANKIRLRRVRKQPLDVDAKTSVLSSPPPAAAGISNKKYLKALVKARKKEAKKLK